VRDLSPAALSRFRALAARSGRLDATALAEADAELLDKLKLTEGRYLKRAAVLLFHPDPLRFVTGAFVRLGFFRSESDLAYHDEIVGDLFAQAQQTQDLLFTKYLKAAITYEGILRVERFPVPREAMREALLNAVVHRDYSVPAPLQIRVYNERLVLVNPAVLPDGWTQASLLAPHYSHPYNPDIANAFFRAGEIETWGRGIQRIFDTCRAANTPAPVVRFEANGLWIEFPFSPDYLAHLRGTPVETPVETLERTPHRILQTPLRTHNPELRRRARVNQKARGYSDTHVVPEVCQKHGISVTSFCVLRQADVLRQRGKESRKGKGFVQPLKAHEHWHVDVA
jgi:ATP-dependent DNA helicase RecG